MFVTVAAAVLFFVTFAIVELALTPPDGYELRHNGSQFYFEELPTDPVEQAKERYASGDITIDEFEEQVEDALRT